MATTRHIRITVEGKTYDVTAEMLDEDIHPHHPAPSAYHAPSVVTPPVFQPAAAPRKAAGGGAVPCPISGTVVTIHVQQGQQVKKGDQLVTLEAMKMNTPVFAPQDGTVASINAQVGVSIEEGATIAVIS
ncbi:MAG: DUF2118 domain-containing protein [Acidobacteriota bacterium]|jgi:biotin carboxyl carrier protein|nr:DUF2118 domain-containing protein [Acidobacteriota bacterium]